MKRPTTPSVIVDLFSDKLRLYGFRTKIASIILNKKAAKCLRLQEVIDLSYNVFRQIPLRYVGWQIAPHQVKKEIYALLAILKKQKVCSILEIGTENGGTLFLFSKVVNKNAKILSLDLPSGDFGGGYGDFKSSFYRSFARGSQQIHLIRGDSHSQNSFNKVKSILGEEKLDILFIDGDHTYDGVKKDYLMYAPLVRKGGLIVFHDICKHTLIPSCKVDEFWNEVKAVGSYIEIIENPKQNWAGIGVLFN